MDQFWPRSGVHYPRSLGEFQSWFRTDADCLDYLDWLRWPYGFICPRCGHPGGWLVADGRYKCAGCGARTSVTAGTLFDHRLRSVLVRPGRSQRAARAAGEDPGKLLPAVHRVASLAKRWLLGPHQGSVEQPTPRQLPRRVHLPLQPAPFPKPRHAVLPRPRTRDCSRASALPRPGRQPRTSQEGHASCTGLPRPPAKPGAPSCRQALAESGLTLVRSDGDP